MKLVACFERAQLPVNHSLPGCVDEAHWVDGSAGGNVSQMERDRHVRMIDCFINVQGAKFVTLHWKKKTPYQQQTSENTQYYFRVQDKQVECKIIGTFRKNVVSVLNVGNTFGLDHMFCLQKVWLNEILYFLIQINTHTSNLKEYRMPLQGRR